MCDTEDYDHFFTANMETLNIKKCSRFLYLKVVGLRIILGYDVVAGLFTRSGPHFARTHS